MKATSVAIVASLAIVSSQLPAAEMPDGPRVRAILEEAGIHGGFVVHVNCGGWRSRNTRVTSAPSKASGSA